MVDHVIEPHILSSPLNLSSDDDAHSVVNRHTIRYEGYHAKENIVLSNLNISLRGPRDCTLEDILALKMIKKILNMFRNLKMRAKRASYFMNQMIVL